MRSIEKQRKCVGIAKRRLVLRSRGNARLGIEMQRQGRHSDYDVELDTEKENSTYKGNECKSMEIHRGGKGMTREEAIEVLNEIFDDSEFNRKAYESWYGMDMAIKALMELPKRRKEVKRWKTKALKTEPKHERWILCSERLPKNEDLVIFHYIR